MARKSRDPRSAATIHEMTPQAKEQFDRFKGGGVVGWARDHDPWAWGNGAASDPWSGRSGSNPGIWPPDVKADP